MVVQLVQIAVGDKMSFFLRFYYSQANPNIWVGLKLGKNSENYQHHRLSPTHLRLAEGIQTMLQMPQFGIRVSFLPMLILLIERSFESMLKGRCLWILLPPGKNFSGRYCFALLFYFNVCRLERLDGSQPNFHTRWRGGLAQTLLKMAVIA